MMKQEEVVPDGEEEEEEEDDSIFDSEELTMGPDYYLGGAHSPGEWDNSMDEMEEELRNTSKIMDDASSIFGEDDEFSNMEDDEEDSDFRAIENLMKLSMKRDAMRSIAGKSDDDDRWFQRMLKQQRLDELNRQKRREEEEARIKLERERREADYLLLRQRWEEEDRREKAEYERRRREREDEEARRRREREDRLEELRIKMEEERMNSYKGNDPLIQQLQETNRRMLNKLEEMERNKIVEEKDKEIAELRKLVEGPKGPPPGSVEELSTMKTKLTEFVKSIHEITGVDITKKDGIIGSMVDGDEDTTSRIAATAVEFAKGVWNTEEVQEMVRKFINKTKEPDKELEKVKNKLEWISDLINSYEKGEVTLNDMQVLRCNMELSMNWEMVKNYRNATLDSFINAVKEKGGTKEDLYELMNRQKILCEPLPGEIDPPTIPRGGFAMDVYERRRKAREQYQKVVTPPTEEKNTTSLLDDEDDNLIGFTEEE